MFGKNNSVKLNDSYNSTVVTGDNNVITTIYSHAAYIPISKPTEAEMKKIRKGLSKDFSRLPIHDSLDDLSIEDYQPLSLMQNRQSLTEEQLLEELNHQEGIELLIIGDIGSGKTTLMKWLIYSYLLKGKLAHYESIFYIDLEKMDDEVKDLQSLLQGQYRHYIGKDVEFEFDEEKTLFIFDGLDKIKSQSQKNLFYKIQKPIMHQIIVSRNNSIDINKINHTDIIYVDGFKGVEELVAPAMKKEFEELENKSNSFFYFVKKLFLTHDLSFRFTLMLFFNDNTMMKKVLKNPLFLAYISTKIKSSNDLNKLFIFDKISRFLLMSYNENRFVDDTKNDKELLNISKKDMRSIAYEMCHKQEINADPFLRDVSRGDVKTILKFGFLKATQLTDSIDPNYRFINPLFHYCLIAEEISQDDQKITFLIQEITSLLQTRDYEKLTDKKLEIFSLFNRKLCAENPSNAQNISKKLENVFDNLSFEVQIAFLFDSHLCIENLSERLKRYENEVNFDYKRPLKNKFDTLKETHCCKEIQ